jgi:hypothetical protein
MSLSLPARPAPGLARRILIATAAASLFAVHAPTARADDKNSCVASYGSSQELRRDKHLGRARDELRSCSRDTCPALVRTDCIAWLDQVQAEFPTLAVRAEKDGGDIANVRVIVDEQVVAARLDGSSLEIEPGEHTLRFETDGAPAVVMKLVLRDREKDRVIPVRFVSTSRGPVDGAARAEALPFFRTVPVGSYVLGGVGIAGVATFGVLGLIGQSRERSLEDTCKPNCSQTSIGSVRGEYIVADVALGIGAAALVSSGIWYFLRPREPHETPPRQEGVALVPGRGSAVLKWSGTF